MAILAEYPEAYGVYSLRRHNNTNDFHPLIRVSRENESYSIEVDVYADSASEISFDSFILSTPSTNATNLGEFLAASGYTDVDSLGSLNQAKINTIYDQAAGNDFVITTSSEGFDLINTSEQDIYRVNNYPAFKGNYINNGLTSIPIIDADISIHYVMTKTDSTTRIGFADDSGLTAGYFGANTDTNEFEVTTNLNLDINLISNGGGFAVLDNTSASIATYTFDSTNTPSSIYTVELNRTSTQASSIQFIQETIVSDVFIYPNYDSQRRFYIESQLSNDYNLAAKDTLNNLTINSFLTQFPNAAAAYSVRSLRGLTGLNGPKVLRVRREVDNAEVDVYTDPTGWVSLDSPVVIVPAITGQIDGGTGVEIDSLASTLGEFVADGDHDDVDSLGSPTTAKVVVWYDQSSADYTIISEEIDARGAPVRIRVVGGTYDAYEFDLYFDDNESISLSSYVADTYEISDGATQVTANLTLGTLQTLVDAGMTDATVCVWYDQSGNGNDATQDVSASQPIIYTGGAIVTEGSAGNEKPAIDFDGVDDFLNVSVITGQPFTYFHSRRFRATSSIAISLNSSTSNYAEVLRGTNVFAMYLGSYLSGDTGNYLHGLSYGLGNSSSSEIGLNGSTYTGNAGAQTGNVITIGKSIQDGANADMKSQELIFYNSDQEAAGNRSGIEQNINNYYDIYGTGNTGVNTPLLDTYSDAAAAYSLRKLRTSYNGPVNLSNRKDAIQNVSTAQPKIYDSSTGVVTKNGKPAFITNNSVDVLSTTALSGLARVDYYAIYSVTDTDYTTASAGLNTTGYACISGASPSPAAFNFGSPTYYVNGTSLGSATRQDILDNTTDGGSKIVVHENGSTATWDNWLFFSRGQSSSLNASDAKIQEAIIYDSDQSDNRIDIENNINSAFQIYAANFSSVLDTVPLAKAAYSIRRLTKNYIGPIITVTNGSTTKDFYADFWGNLNVEAIVDHVNGGSYDITKWWDQSGKGNHLESTANHPTLNISNNQITGITVNSTNSFDNDLNNIAESINASSFPERTDYLLDDYSGAAVAYSLRKIRENYTGPLVRVRKDGGDNAEVDVYPDSNNTISISSPIQNVTEITDPDTPASTTETTFGDFISGFDGKVVVWYDQAADFTSDWYTVSNSQNNAVQEISGSQPKIYDSATGVVLNQDNEKATVGFDGNRFMRVASGIGIEYPYNYHTFVAFRKNLSPLKAYIYDSSNRHALTTDIFGFDAAEGVLVKTVNSSNGVSDSDVLPDGSFVVSVLQSSAPKLYINSVDESDITIAGNTDFGSFDDIYIGSRFTLTHKLSGNIHELILYPSDQTANRTGIEGNINDHYSIYDNTNKLVAVYDNSIQRTIALNSASYTDLKEIIHYE